MSTQATEIKISASPAYWTHRVDKYPGPVAVTRMAQLIDFDDRLYEGARVVYRFLINYYHRDHGDALLSMRHVSKTMRARTPQAKSVLSHSGVRRAIIALMETGWVVRTVKGRGKGKTASRYVPTLNVLDLAALGQFPELLHPGETVEDDSELVHSNETVGEKLVHLGETVEAELLHPGETKTPIPDPRTLDSQSQGMGNGSEVSGAPPADGLSATASAPGFERVWKAYGKLGNKAAAREAFAAIVDPDVDHIATRAKAWAASARPGQKRMPLEKWLAAEKYDEADRRVAPANDDKPAAATSKPAKWVGDVPAVVSPGQHTVFIRDARHIIDGDGNHEVTLVLDVDQGNLVLGEVPHRFFTEHRDEALQRKGAKHLENVCAAAGISDIEDVGELVGKHVIADVGVDGSIRYVPGWKLEEAA